MKQITLILMSFLSMAMSFGGHKISESETPLNRVLSGYYNIKNSLVKDDANAASLHAGEFIQFLKSVDAKTLSQSQLKEYNKLQELLSSDAVNINKSKNIEQQRKYFASLSVNIWKLAGVVKLSDGKMYYQYCSMKKNYWVSETTTIKNPYYGKQMITCGNNTAQL